MSSQQQRLDALEMARGLAGRVEAIADYLDSGPDAELQAYVHGFGPQQHAAARMAGQLALVSIAGDLRRIADKIDQADAVDVEASPPR